MIYRMPDKTYCQITVHPHPHQAAWRDLRQARAYTLTDFLLLRGPEFESLPFALSNLFSFAWLGRFGYSVLSE